MTWVLSIPGGRVAMTLSPELSRGFSGEGGLLLDLASDQAGRDAATVSAATATLGRFSLADAVAASGLPQARAAAALTWLGVHGHRGFDAADGAFFRRHLPFPDDLLAVDPPRLRDARALAASAAVKPLARGGWAVTSGGSEYRARLDAGGFACTCAWVARHGTSRGPCKHVLAAAIVRAAAREPVA